MFKPLDPLLHSELRLAVVSLLISAEEAEFPYIKVERTFKGKKPCTLCRITPVGLKAFEDYVDALKSYLEVK